MENEEAYILGIEPSKPNISNNDTVNTSRETSNNKTIWTHNETSTLIAAIEIHYSDTQYIGQKAKFWKTISEELKRRGILFADLQCHRKWANLVRTYRKAKINKSRTGRGPVKFMFYNSIDAILGKGSSPNDLFNYCKPEESFDSQPTYIKVETPDDECESMDIADFESHYTVENHEISMPNNETAETHDEKSFNNWSSSSTNPTETTQEKSSTTNNVKWSLRSRPVKRKTNVFLERKMELMRLKRVFFETKITSIRRKETMRKAFIKESLNYKKEKLELYKRQLVIEEEKVKALKALKTLLNEK